ncbi:hypothetical protein [Ruania alba]|uniref:EcsC protein family protein n=1 Tax=Ruania alba TaxID=648782 RepID=A0A1H5CY87_9MICO|nr:hypothetical protein [Ruania alba]SED71464.1 hypothetical protein SAMN04488554_0507 [Ruania alba]
MAPRLDHLIDAATTIPSTQVRRYVDGLRRAHPDASPAELIALMERRYLMAVSTSGGAVGAAAAFPVVGTGVAIALTAGQVGAFVAASAALTLAVADVHGIATEDAARRRALLLTTLLGENGPELLEQQLGLSTATWAQVLLTRMPVATVKTVNKALRGRVAKAVVAKGGSVMLGRLVPFGIGAVIGYAGGRVMGKNLIEGMEAAFGAAPAEFARELESLIEVTEITSGDDPDSRDLFADAARIADEAAEPDRPRRDTDLD